MENEEVKTKVREAYSRIATMDSGCGCNAAKVPAKRSGGCCGGTSKADTVPDRGLYSAEELATIPEGAELGLGCGNPVALASIKEGERVLDLGSGAGVDCFLAARKTGPKGRVIGVDMTAEMVSRARGNAASGGFANVEFRLGEIENLPVETGTIDLVISNCVINLSTDKPRVFSEIMRVLAPGGRFMVSDMVTDGPLPARIRESVNAYAGCIAGAMEKDEYLRTVREAGFVDIRVTGDEAMELSQDDPFAAAIMKDSHCTPEEALKAASSVRSLGLSARKP